MTHHESCGWCRMGPNTDRAPQKRQPFHFILRTSMNRCSTFGRHFAHMDKCAGLRFKGFFQGCRLSPLAQYPLKSSRSVSARSPKDRWPKCMKPLVFPRCSIGQLQKCKQWRYCIRLIMTMGYPGYCESTKE